ncbi:hypothetical protein ACCO45_002317 [Purpureocillium lilacinum]|uniref:Uncharacterized protein n=1 Tax=Purpureocillium lilacinum TaxID=33203 RepID=A0ACC4EAT1_PURLI
MKGALTQTGVLPGLGPEPAVQQPLYQHQQSSPPLDRHEQAPEVHYAAQSPVTHVSNLEQEYKRQYLERRAAEHPMVPNDDTAKEVMPFDETAKVVVPSEMQHGQYPQTATSTNYSAPWGDNSTTVDDGHSEHHKRQPSTAAGASTIGGRGAGASLPPPPSEKGGGKKKILGMSRKGFLILLAVLLIIVAAAVGGGVGGAVASTKSKSDSSAPAATSTTASASTTPTSTSATSSSATPTHTPAPIFLNNMTVPGNGLAFQGFARDNFSGAYTDIVTKEKGTDFEFDIHSYVWRPRLTSCCLSFCNNATNEGYVGYWCNERNQTSASSSFSRIFVWCGNDHSEKNAKCV